MCYPENASKLILETFFFIWRQHFGGLTFSVSYPTPTPDLRPKTSQSPLKKKKKNTPPVSWVKPRYGGATLTTAPATGAATALIGLNVPEESARRCFGAGHSMGIGGAFRFHRFGMGTLGSWYRCTLNRQDSDQFT